MHDRDFVENQWRRLGNPAWIDQLWLDKYKASMHIATRQPIADALASVMPFSTVLDVGCNCGALMPTILRANTDAQVTGIDLNAFAITDARRTFPAHTWVAASIVDWLPMMVEAGRRWDVVTSGSSLCCLPPQIIDDAMHVIARAATRAIVLQEIVATDLYPEGISSAGTPEWRYDLARRLHADGWHEVGRVWQQLDTARPAAVMTFTREDGHGEFHQ